MDRELDNEVRGLLMDSYGNLSAMRGDQGVLERRRNKERRHAATWLVIFVAFMAFGRYIHSPYIGVEYLLFCATCSFLYLTCNAQMEWLPSRQTDRWVNDAMDRMHAFFQKQYRPPLDAVPEKVDYQLLRDLHLTSAECRSRDLTGRRRWSNIAEIVSRYITGLSPYPYVIILAISLHRHSHVSYPAVLWATASLMFLMTVESICLAVPSYYAIFLMINLEERAWHVKAADYLEKKIKASQPQKLFGEDIDGSGQSVGVVVEP